MRFTVPQFIEYEPKIVGPFTFKQFIFVGIAGAICFIIYFTAPFYIFVLSCIIVGGGALALASLKIEGIPLPNYIANFVKFNFSTKMYLWKKKGEKETDAEKKPIKKSGGVEDELPLKIAGNSQLKNIKRKIETRKKEDTNSDY
jgi:hypothetical protein